MKHVSNQAILIFFCILSITLLYLLSPILTPFLLAALLAYLSDPLVKRLEKWHVPHLLSVILVFIFLFSLLALFILLLFPIAQKQITALIEVLPKIFIWAQHSIVPYFQKFINFDQITANLPSTIAKTGWVFTTVLKSSYTLIEWGINIVLTPVVTFYFLRDWDKILMAIRNMLPKSTRPTILKLAQDSDEVLSAFIRGQFLVMISLSVIYGIGLTLVGLSVGLMIGIIGGLLSIVPYLGSLFVIVAATITALVQFGTWDSLIWVFIVFFIGQAIEGYILTPYFVGGRIGLHPVAVIFAIMAGGALFGFFGVLLALPVAAVSMVLLRFLHKRYVT